MLYFAWVILDHSRSAIVGPSVTYTFGVDRIYSFGNIAIVLAFLLENAIHVAMSAAYRRVSG